MTDNKDPFEQQLQDFIDRRESDLNGDSGDNETDSLSANESAPEMDQLWQSIQSLKDHSFPELDAFDAKTRNESNNSANPSKESGNTQVIDLSRARIQKAARMGLAIAASLMFFAALNFSYFGVPQTYKVARGTQQLVSLKDGSELTLQGGSKLTLYEGWGQRRVAFDRGYVFFSVSKNSDKPFIIDNDKGLVRVLGTSFSVYNVRKKLEVVVESGRVSVTPSNNPQADSTVILEKNDKLVMDDQGISGVQHDINPSEEFSWREGEVFFNEQTLEDVLARMSDFYPQSVQILNSSHRKTRLSGSYSTSDFDSFLNTLALAADLHIERTPNGGILIH